MKIKRTKNGWIATNEAGRILAFDPTYSGLLLTLQSL